MDYYGQGECGISKNNSVNITVYFTFCYMYEPKRSLSVENYTLCKRKVNGLLLQHTVNCKKTDIVFIITGSCVYCIIH